MIICHPILNDRNYIWTRRAARHIICVICEGEKNENNK